MIKSTDLYKNTGAIHTDPENDKYLNNIKKLKNIDLGTDARTPQH